MATIPLGNFGQSVVQPGRQQRVFKEQAGEVNARTTASVLQGVSQAVINEVEY
jgi:hypothetical protein